MLRSFQVYSFPLHDIMELHIRRWGFTINWWKRVILRTIYVAITTLIACLLPFFGQIIGLIGAVGIGELIGSDGVIVILSHTQMGTPAFSVCMCARVGQVV